MNDYINRRPIHYLGSKLRILDFIGKNVDVLEPTGGRVCDLFSGSGTVSTYFSMKRNVTAVDIQEYSRVLCSALLLPTSQVIESNDILYQLQASPHTAFLFSTFRDLLEYEENAICRCSEGSKECLYDIIENGSIANFEIANKCNSKMILYAILKETVDIILTLNLNNSPAAMMLRHFGGLYFSYKQALWLDAILELTFSQSDDRKKNVMLAAALSTASSIVNTIGKQFAQPLQVISSNGKLKENLSTKITNDRSLDTLAIYAEWLNFYVSAKQPPCRQNIIIRDDFRVALKELRSSDVKIVYADPPYSRYHYSRYYHVLETMSLRDNPTISTTFPNQTQISRGVYRTNRHQSPFSIKSKAGKAFEQLFEGVSSIKVPLLLSYSPYPEKRASTPRMQTIDQLFTLAKQYYNSIEVVSPGEFQHSKLNSTDKNFEAVDDAELLLVCK